MYIQNIMLSLQLPTPHNKNRRYRYRNNMSNKIKHSGIVKSISHHCITVQIVQTAACTACQAAAHCHAAESKEKLIKVYGIDTGKYRIGESVIVCITRSVARLAVWLGFGLPFLILVVSLFAAAGITHHEGLSAMVGLLMLVPYYALLYLLRDRLKARLYVSLAPG